VPRLAAQETEVALVSSNPLVARIPESVRIPAARSYAVTTLTTGSVAGQATITATTRGGALATADVTVVSAVDAAGPLRLVLFASPADLLAGGQPPGVLSVVLLGTDGRPAPATEELSVIVTSSNPAVAQVPERVTVLKGAHFAQAGVQPLAAGSAVLSALYPGYVSEFIEVHVSESGEEPEALALYLAPPVLRFPESNPQGAIVQAMDSARRPVPFPCVPVHLASSSPLTVVVASPVEVSCGASLQYVVAEVSAKLPGEAAVSASASGLRPASANVTVQGQVPAQLKVYLAPEQALAVEAAPGFVVVQVVDERGLPVSSHGGMPIRLIRDGEVLQRGMAVPAGESYAAAPLEQLAAGGQAEVWLVNPALASAHVSITLLTLPTSAALTAASGPLFPGQQVGIQLRALSGGEPLPQARLTWTVTNGRLRDAAPETDERGEAAAVFSAGSPGDGLVAVTMSKDGYDEATARLQITVVAPPEPIGPPDLFGVPVLYLLLAIPLVVLAYLAYKLLPGWRRRA
jgi:hypothetical protein